MRPQRPKLREDTLVERRSQVGGASRAARAHLVADDPLDGQDMLVAPRREGIVDIDQLFSELVEIEPTLGVAIDFEPRGGELVDRAAAEVEARALERRGGAVAQAGLGKRRLEPSALGGPRRIMFKIR